MYIIGATSEERVCDRFKERFGVIIKIDDDIKDML